MAVYTHLAAKDLDELVAHYDVGTLTSAKGIAEGVSNSNWLIETTGADAAGARFILTMYERRIDYADLPFFLGLLDHLSEHDCPVPRTIHDREGAAYRMIDGKAVALIEFLPGVSVDHPTVDQARSVGEALARVHIAAKDFPTQRPNSLGIMSSAKVLSQCGAEALSGIDPALPPAITIAHDLAASGPEQLPQSIIHSDLFPDNVLMIGSNVSGMIDFYFACSDAMAYDLAVTHAAWAFERGGSTFHEDVGEALIEGYESVRSLSQEERDALPVLAQGACLRFVASRAEDWLETPHDALVTRKDPMDFMRRLETYRSRGGEIFS
ncbi:homoserine kinase [Altererythrobacter sp. MF3-039]|uniref:homoserine kinase n=1 Tax=Altererythrobacter sp. MF3-039 TaxID=3252901 RepID=UPI00390CD864